MHDVSGSRLTSADLLEVAVRSEPDATMRSLELWRHKGLLPHPERTSQDGTRPVWTYPPETGEQLRALLELRKHTKDPNILSAALWFDGYAVNTEDARSGMLNYIKSMLRDVEKVLAKQSSRPSADNTQHGREEAIEATARKLATSRGKKALRISRQSLDERTRAFALLLSLSLGESGATRRLNEDAPALERAMGVDRARRYRPAGAQPWISGSPEEGLAHFHEVGSMPRLIWALATATADELEAARLTARTFLDGLGLFSQLADAFAGYANASGMAAISMLRSDPVLRVLMIAFVLSVRQSPAMNANLNAIDAALTANVLPIVHKLQELAQLPDDQRRERLPGLEELPWPQRRALERAIESFNSDDSGN